LDLKLDGDFSPFEKKKNGKKKKKKVKKKKSKKPSVTSVISFALTSVNIEKSSDDIYLENFIFILIILIIIIVIITTSNQPSSKPSQSLSNAFFKLNPAFLYIIL
jgi:K+-sensing histidine kinase KdpD